MRSGWRSNRVLLFLLSMLLCSGLIALSIAGTLTTAEDAAATPLNFVSGIFNRISITVTQFVEDIAEVQTLRDRNGQLEEQLIRLQSELIELREIANDYSRLAEIVDYTQSTENQEFVTADVVGVEQSGFSRTIIINRGTRDGLEVGMPVTTPLGLIGRIVDTTANASKVQLITDENSAVSSRLQTSRAEGSIVGDLGGNLRMTFIPLGETVAVGELAVTSGLGGSFPPNLVVGQVTSVREFEFDLFIEAEIRSLVDFDSLEFVLVMTSFEPADNSIFEDEEEAEQ